MKPLYRSEALRHATRRLEGGILLPAPLSVWVVGGALAGSLVFAGWLVSTASYARKETVMGWLSSEGGVVRVPAPRGGAIARLHVGEGDPIEAHGRLATLRLLDDGEAGGGAAALVTGLTEQRDAVRDEATATVRGLEVEVDRLAAQEMFLEAELQDARAEVTLQERRVALAEQDLQRAAGLAELGLLSRSDREVKAAALFGARQRRASLMRTATAIEREISDVAGRLDAIPETAAAALSRAAVAVAALDERLTRAAMEIEYVVTAPIAGRVDALPVRVGQSVAPGASVAVIVPADAELIAELYVPSRAAGFVEAGQAVRIRYEAFPYQRFGSQVATVSEVSRTVLAPGETDIPGVQPQEPVFRVRGRLAAQQVDAYGAALPLRAGMLLAADIVVDRRTLLEWLLDPLYAVGRR